MPPPGLPLLAPPPGVVELPAGVGDAGLVGVAELDGVAEALADGLAVACGCAKIVTVKFFGSVVPD